MKSEISIRSDAHFRGYQRLGANVTRYDGGFQRDWHEAIDLYRELSVQVSGTGRCPALHVCHWAGTACPSLQQPLPNLAR